MNTDSLDHFVHLHMNPDLDPDLLGAALAVRQMSVLVTNGGSHFGHPESQSSVPPQVVIACIDRAITKGGPFQDLWQQLRAEVVQLVPIWEQGKGQFQKDLADATEYNEIALLLTEQSVRNHYAEATAQHLYWNEYPRKQWFLHGYMVAWRQWQQQSECALAGQD